MASDVKFAVVNGLSPAAGSPNQQDFTSPGFGTPKGAVIYISGSTADGLTSNAKWGVGAWDTGTASWAVGFSATDGGGTEETTRRTSNQSQRVIFTPTGSDSLWAEADYDSTITDGIRINWVQTPGAGFYITVILIGGADVQVNVGDFLSNASSTPKTVTTGIPQDLVYLVSDGGNTTSEELSAPSGHFAFLQGWGDGTTSMGASVLYNDSSANGDPQGGFSASKVPFWWPAADRHWTIENFTSTSFDFTMGGTTDVGRYFFYIAIDVDTLSVFNDAADTPTSTGDWQRAGYGFQPGFIWGYGMGEATSAGLETVQLHTTDLDGVACPSILMSDGTTDSCIGAADQDNAATINTSSVSTQSGVFISYDDTQTTKHSEATVSSFDADGVTFNFTTAAAARYVNFFAIGEVPAATLLTQERAISRRVFGRTFGRVN